MLSSPAFSAEIDRLQMRTAPETQEEYEESVDLDWKIEVTRRLQLRLVRELGYRGEEVCVSLSMFVGCSGTVD